MRIKDFKDRSNGKGMNRPSVAMNEDTINVKQA